MMACDDDYGDDDDITVYKYCAYSLMDLLVRWLSSLDEYTLHTYIHFEI